MKVFFYVQHLLGIGHLKRIEVDVQLPPASAADLTFRTLLDENRQPVDDDWKRHRAAALLDAWRASRAQVLLIELFPFGRRQMRFELLPLLEDARRLAPRPLVVCSVRDLIQSRPEREAETVSLVERFFDRILVHGDPHLAGFERTFAAAPRFGSKLQYTGYVVAASAAAREHGAEVVVSAGGGAVGRRLLECAMLAREQTLLRGATWRVLAGINCAEADYRALERLVRPGIVHRLAVVIEQRPECEVGRARRRQLHVDVDAPHRNAAARQRDLEARLAQRRRQHGGALQVADAE